MRRAVTVAGPSDSSARARGETQGVTEEEGPICPATGCGAEATHRLVWNNPRVHTADREKLWTACPEHREPLSHHLAIRSFLRRVEPVDRSR